MGYSPENNPYIPGDPYSYDLKWIVEKIKPIKDVEDLAEAAKASAEEAEQSAIRAEDAKQDASDAATAAERSAQDAEDALDTLTDALVEGITPLADDVRVLEERVTAFETLAEGSTTGDAELMDIRIGGNGVTYANAGDAVRAQYDENADNFANLIQNYPDLTLPWAVGNIISTGSTNAQVTGLRAVSNNNLTPIIQAGDYYFVQAPYLADVHIYNSKVFTTANHLTEVWHRRRGALQLPPEYAGKYAAVSIKKEGHESDDISADLATIDQYVKYIRSSLAAHRTDTTLSVSDVPADAKACGDALDEQAVDLLSIIPEMDAFRFTWDIGQSISSSGAILTSNGFAKTRIIPVQEGNIIINTTGDTGEDGQITSLMVAEYSGSTFQARVTLNADPYRIPAGIDGIALVYGYTSANPDPHVMTALRLDKFFSCRLLNSAQPVGYIGDGEHPAYVAFGASTTIGAVHGFGGITYSDNAFPEYLGKVLNLKTYNLAVGSTGFLERGDPGSPTYGTKPNFMDQIYTHDAQLKEAKLVTIMFGYGNDNYVGSPAQHFPIGKYTDYYPYDEAGYHPSGDSGLNTMLSKGATFMGCLNWCIKWISEKYPYAQLALIFGSPSANAERAVTMTAQSEGPGVAPYKLNYVEDPYRDDPDHYGSNYGIYLINEELKKLKAAIDVPIINFFYDENAFNWYQTYAKDPDDATLYALFSTTGSALDPHWNSHPSEAGYLAYARFIAGKIGAVFTH